MKEKGKNRFFKVTNGKLFLTLIFFVAIFYLSGISVDTFPLFHLIVLIILSIAVSYLIACIILSLHIHHRRK